MGLAVYPLPIVHSFLAVRPVCWPWCFAGRVGQSHPQIVEQFWYRHRCVKNASPPNAWIQMLFASKSSTPIQGLVGSEAAGTRCAKKTSRPNKTLGHFLFFRLPGNWSFRLLARLSFLFLFAYCRPAGVGFEALACRFAAVKLEGALGP